MRQTINVTRTSYEPNTLGGDCPMQAGQQVGGFVSYPERIEAVKERQRGETFLDKHCKALAATGAGIELLPAEGSPAKSDDARPQTGNGRPRQTNGDAALSTGGDGQVSQVVADFITAIARCLETNQGAYP